MFVSVDKVDFDLHWNMETSINRIKPNSSPMQHFYLKVEN